MTKDDAGARRWTSRLDERVPGLARSSFTQPMAMRLDELISGVRADVAIKVFGDDPDATARWPSRSPASCRDVAGADEVQVEPTQGQTYLNVRLRRDAMARFGIPIAEVQEALETAVGGRPVSQVVEGKLRRRRRRPVPRGAAQLGRGDRRDHHSRAANGARIALAQIADIRLEGGPVQVSRERRAASGRRAGQRARARPRRVRDGRAAGGRRAGTPCRPACSSRTAASSRTSSGRMARLQYRRAAVDHADRCSPLRCRSGRGRSRGSCW